MRKLPGAGHGIPHAGPAVHPECDIAEMRYLRERKGLPIPKIAMHFDGIYTDKYIRDVVEYIVRADIPARKP